MPTRRFFLGFFLPGAALAGLAGCADGDPLARVHADTDLLVTGLRAGQARLMRLPPGIVPSGTFDTMHGYVQQVAIFAADVDSAALAPQAAAAAQDMAAVATEVLVLAYARKLPGDARALYAACGAVLMAIESQLGLPASPPTADALFYTPAQARVLLTQAGYRAG